MGWTSCIIWFLYVSVSEYWRLANSKPQMYKEVQSPQYPQPYAPNLLEQWNLSVPEGYRIRLTFTHLDIEASEGCIYDALTILYDDKVLEKFCGHANSSDGYHPGNQPILSPGNRLTLIFQTDNSKPEHHQNVGFSAKYKPIDIDECSELEPTDGLGLFCSQICLNTLGSYLCACRHGFELHSDQHTCVSVCPAVVTPHSSTSPQQLEYSQGQTVTVTCDLGHVSDVQSNKALSSQYVTTCQSTGVWSPSYTCEPVDCGFPDIPVDGILYLVGSDDPPTQYKDQIQFNCSSSYYILDGDDTYTCNANGDWESSGAKTVMPKCIEVCGRPEKHVASAGRILGGEDANLGQLPWNLLIREPSRGGAALINDRWAVTAAYVVENVPEHSLRLYGGMVNSGTIFNRFSNVVVMDSEKIIIHPNYIKVTGERINFDNDIALIRLASRVTLGPNLLPICLPEANGVLLENEMGTVSGWGITDVTVKGRTAFATSKSLKYAHIGIYSESECRDTPHTPSNTRMTFTENMFCAGAEGKDSCRRDDGGPFISPMLAEGSQPYYLTGIVSWGAPCRQRNYKGYYTKVANYVNWIKETIETIEKS